MNQPPQELHLADVDLEPGSRHPGLVVGAQQRVPAPGHDVVASLGPQHRHVRRIEHGPPARERDTAAVVSPVQERLDASDCVPTRT
jgi:hypothetical protein